MVRSLRFFESLPVDPWKTVRIGHSCAAVSSDNSSPAEFTAGQSQSTFNRSVKAEEKVLFCEERKLGVRILDRWFSPRSVERSRESFIAKMRGEPNEKRIGK